MEPELDGEGCPAAYPTHRRMAAAKEARGTDRQGSLSNHQNRKDRCNMDKVLLEVCCGSADDVIEAHLALSLIHI